MKQKTVMAKSRRAERGHDVTIPGVRGSGGECGFAEEETLVLAFRCLALLYSLRRLAPSYST